VAAEVEHREGHEGVGAGETEGHADRTVALARSTLAQTNRSVSWPTTVVRHPCDTVAESGTGLRGDHDALAVHVDVDADERAVGDPHHPEQRVHAAAGGEDA
jgi:hypothetical protein